MLLITFLNYATKRLRAGAMVALITALSITLLSACADGNDIEAAEDTSWTSISAAEETAHASGLSRAGDSTPGTMKDAFAGEFYICATVSISTDNESDNDWRMRL